MWDFSSPEKEAECLADFVSAQMAEYKLVPRDFSILVRQKAAEYMKVLEPHFAAKGLYLRNEAAQIGPIAIQELLAEDLSDILMTLLRLLTSDRAGRHWTECLETVCMLKGLASDDDTGRSRVAKDLDDFGATFKKRFPTPPNDLASVQGLVKELIGFVGRRNLLAWSPAYRQGAWLDKVTDAATRHLAASCRGSEHWSDALDIYEGTHAVPLMTIHKSKGLEYHTVIFVGLDDDAWWSFANDAQEATAGFFVAFTRARQRVVFTYCASRGTQKKSPHCTNY